MIILSINQPSTLLADTAVQIKYWYMQHAQVGASFTNSQMCAIQFCCLASVTTWCGVMPLLRIYGYACWCP
jgi:hypothetical protein